jgi:hypothetical protein
MHNLVYIPLVIFIFKIFTFSFKLHYRTEAVAYQNILKAAVQCKAVNHMLQVYHLTWHEVLLALTGS